MGLKPRLDLRFSPNSVSGNHGLLSWQESVRTHSRRHQSLGNNASPFCHCLMLAVVDSFAHLDSQTPSFSKIDMDILAKVGICSDVGLVLSKDKRGEIEAEGKAPAAASGLSFDAIVQLIKVVRSRLMVSQCQLPEFILSHAFLPVRLRPDVEC
jgi:hypothetical protein